MERKSNKYQSAWWSIDLPDRWSVEEHPECATFTSPDFQGVLQLSAYRKDSEIAEDDILELADSSPKPRAVQIGNFVGFSNTQDVGDIRWKKWWLVKDRTLIFATYNGPTMTSDREIPTAENLLKTVVVTAHC